MSNEKQTAVEWLLDRIEDVDLTEKLWENVKQQAKEMERDMLTDAYHDGKVNGMDISHPLSLTKEISAKEYYEKTYGGNK
jgi:spore coat polysaccharide biosynthesis protein SpsF (cytidylyltransferase family)